MEEELSPEFILTPEHRPKLETVEPQNIPLIDLSPIDTNSDLRTLVTEIGDACKNWGFFQVINHGVPPKCRESLDSASRKFFSLPKTEKKELSRDLFNPYGYYDTEHTKNVRDWKEILECTARTPLVLPASHHPEDTEVREFRNIWPRNLPQLREAVEEYAVEMEKLAFKLLELVAMSLNLKKDRLNAFFDDHTSRVKLNYYPVCPLPHLALGTGRHKDGGALTILAQDAVSGLQVKRQSDGEWIPVEPNLDAYIVNVGDIIQVWSNEKYKSVEHRATVNSEKERLSIPYFFNPAHYTRVAPLQEMVNEENPPKYRGYNWGKFIVTRNRDKGSYSFHCRTLSSLAMGEVDPAFIQDPEHRPKPETIAPDNIPTIDLSPLLAPEPDPTALQNLVAEVGGACRDWGFFQVINHGVAAEFKERIESASREFFSLQKEEKKKVARDEVKPIGYYDTEHTKNVRDWKEVFDFTVKEPMLIPSSHEPHDEELMKIWNQWPQYPPHMREVCLGYAAEMEKLGFKLLELIALSLGLERERFKGFFFENDTTFIRLNHYPPCPASDLALGVGRHKDAGALTILAQDDVGGLQVKRKSDGEWVLVKPNPNSYIINVGDIIQVWSNDEYESVEHRVKVNAERERFSIPYFMNPAHDTVVEPLAEVVSEESPARYKGYSWGKFFTSRKRSNFKKLEVENVQIYHFKN